MGARLGLVGAGWLRRRVRRNTATMRITAAPVPAATQMAALALELVPVLAVLMPTSLLGLVAV